MQIQKIIPEQGKLLGLGWASPKKFYGTKGFLNFDWCFQRTKSLFGVLHREGGFYAG
tara:strand:- start:743 stop:913 length:171 start_codon:yes stop_codon:yes gene_type:complete